jgi:hypothetical protein
MTLLRRKLPSLLGAAALSVTFMASGVMTAAAAPNVTCAGGPIAVGTYNNLTITGFCQANQGDITIQRNLYIQPGAGLLAAFGGSNVNVGRDILVGAGASLILGCEPNAFTCFNDPENVSSTFDSVGHNLVATGALLMIVHHSTIWGEVAQTGGGGGVNCRALPFGPPAYTTYEDNVMHGDVTVAGMHTCWAGFFRNNVSGSVNWNNNITWDGTPEPPGDPTIHGDEDGNEITTNTIHQNLSCFDNIPAIQFGDSGGTPNTVLGTTRGQCLAVV